MNKKPVPIYSYKEKGRTGYTIFLDKQTMKVYKAYQKEVSQTLYWICFFAAIFVMRSIITLSIHHPFYKSIFMLGGIAISLLIGVAIHKKSVGSLKEIYLSKEMLNDYINEGKKRFIFEIILTLAILLCAVLCIVLFLLYSLLIWLLFTFILFVVIGILVCNFSLTRFQLYKNGIWEGKKMIFRLTRDSVAMGDDVFAPHEKTINISTHETLDDLIGKVKDMHYLPSIYGGKATWVLYVDKKLPIAVIAQQWEKSKLLVSPQQTLEQFLKGSEMVELFFRYYGQKSPDDVFQSFNERPL